MIGHQLLSGDLVNGTCTAPPARSEWMREIVLAHLPRGRAVRVLDLGCGTGSLLFRLAESLPDATLIGIDVSPANISAARQEAKNLSATRIHFEVADYLAYRAGPFDMIVADGVLHLVQVETLVLVGKLAGDLRTGGLFVCGMPFECAYNRAFAVVRRGLARIRSPWLDRRILQVGRLVHGRDMDEERLRERVPYMYLPPERLMGDSLLERFASAGLARTAEYPAPSTSPSQLRHRVTVFVRLDA